MKQPRKPDIITIGVYAVIFIAVLYFAAAIGTCLDLSVGENGKTDIDKFSQNLNSTVSDTDLVLEHLRMKGSNSLKFAALAAGGLALYVLMKVTDKRKFHRKGEEHGSARWANDKERKSLLDIPQKPEKEKKPEISDDEQDKVTIAENPIDTGNAAHKDKRSVKTKKRKLEEKEDNNIILSNSVKMSLNIRQTRKNLNVLVIGGSGSGKSRFYVKPNLMQANTSYCVTDPKGELLRSTGKFLEGKGYRIKVFNLINMKNSGNYNPFAYVYDSDGNYSETAVIKMVNVLMKNTKKSENSGGDQFWDDSTTALLAALSFYLVECEGKEKQNFSEVMNLLKKAEAKDGDDDFQSELDLIFDYLEHPENYTEEKIKGNQALENISLPKLENPKKPHEYMCLKYYRDFKKAAGDTAKSILISTAVRLQAFNIPDVMSLTCTDSLELHTLGDKKTALFIIIPSTDDTFNFLAAMLYTQMFDALYDRANFYYDGALKVHVRCMLDEFANLGQIPRFEELLATMRSMEISANVIIQNLSQLKKMYKDSWENVTGNCDSLLYLGGQEPSTLEHISKLLGKETIDTRSRNRTRGRNGSTSENDGILGRELMTTDELKVMKDDKCILFVKGVYPFFCDKFKIEKHRNYGLLADSDKANAFDVSRIVTERYTAFNEEKDKENHSEPTKVENDIEQGKRISCEDVPDTDFEQSVTETETIGARVHVSRKQEDFPKKGAENAHIEESDCIRTSQPDMPKAVNDDSELDIFN